MDLAPGVRIQQDCLSLADEDFEDYVRTRGESAEQAVQVAAATRALARVDRDDYAARNVAYLLFTAGEVPRVTGLCGSRTRTKAGGSSRPRA